jgi:type II secretory pathway pseudopilin PulG
MLSSLRLRIALLAPARSERGFTLIETLVAMVTGLVVTGALFAILEFSMKEDTRITNVSQATQLGRGAMTHIVDELHSSCISSGFNPVLAESSETKLIFVNGYSEKAEVPSVATATTGVRRDEIEWTGEKGNLTDTTSLSAGEFGGNYTWGTPSTVKIGELISKGEENKVKQPIFRYYEYAEHTTTGSGEVNSLKEISLGGGKISASEAEKVAAVNITFRTAPTTLASKAPEELAHESADLSSLVTLAFSAPNSESTIKAGPCE